VSLAEEFEENVVDLAFFQPTEIEEENGATRTGYPDEPTFTTKGIFQMADGSITFGRNGARMSTTNDVFIDKDADANAMYRGIMDSEEKWVMDYDGRRFFVDAIEAAGEAEDPYILQVSQIKKPG
jgi:hypothetical protein